MTHGSSRFPGDATDAVLGRELPIGCRRGFEPPVSAVIRFAAGSSRLGVDGSGGQGRIRVLHDTRPPSDLPAHPDRPVPAARLPALAMSHFDQVVVLYNGTMLCAGPPEEVLIPDNLRVVFDVRAYIARLPEAISPHLIIDSL